MNKRFKGKKAMQAKDKIRTQFVARLKESMANSGVPEWGAGAYLAKLTKTTPKASSKWLNAESMPGRKNMEILADALGVRIEWLEYGEGNKTNKPELSAQESQQTYSPSKNDYALIRQYSAVGECGDGYLNDHVELSDGLAFKRDWLARIGAKAENLAVIYASGASMEPYIFDGDVVLFDTSDVEPKHGQVFVVRRPDCSVSIKRLVQQLSGDWVIKSDNPDRSEEKVTAETIHELPFVGRVIWRGGNIS